MNRVAFPLPQQAVRQLDDLARWARQQHHVGAAMGRQGRERPGSGAPGPAADSFGAAGGHGRAEAPGAGG
eukprot:27982-Alexandrium_andersonii.AAC.1